MQRHGMRRVFVLTGSLALVASAGAGWASSATGSETTEPCPTQTLELWPSITLPPLAETDMVTPGTVLDGTTHGDIQTLPGVSATRTARAARLEWQRDGRWFGFGNNYKVTDDDIGSTLTQVVAVEWTEGCRRSTVLASPPPVRVKAPTTVVLKQARPGVLDVRVDQVGDAAPIGFVRVTWTGKRRGSHIAEMRPAADGRTKVRLPLTVPGRYKVTAFFVDSSGIAFDSRSKALTVK